jgi:membrane associated rhomboid family serine protease
MLIPVQVDVPMSRWPWMNWVLLFALFCAFLWELANPDDAIQYILGIENASDGEVYESGWSWVGHMFLHAGWIHLIGNGLFMWVFGNAVCAKIGNLQYLIAWLVLGLAAGGSEQVISHSAILGASGAINGIVGMYLVLYPLNEITMWYFFLYRTGTFSLSSFWMILLWLGFDIWGAASGGGGVAYIAHLGGFGAGALLAFGLLTVKFLESDEHERTIVDMLSERREKKPRPKTPTGPAPVQSRPMSAPARFSRSEAPIPLEPPEHVAAVPAVVAAKVAASDVSPHQRLHVRLANGKIGQLAASDILRHESQGKAVNNFAVSEDGTTWTTFGQWRKNRQV